MLWRPCAITSRQCVARRKADFQATTWPAPACSSYPYRVCAPNSERLHAVVLQKANRKKVERSKRKGFRRTPIPVASSPAFSSLPHFYLFTEGGNTCVLLHSKTCTINSGFLSRGASVNMLVPCLVCGARY